MIIRQPFCDQTGKKYTREIEILLEDLRCDDRPNNQIAVVARDEFTSVYAVPEEYVSALLSAKRTYVPADCLQTYLIQPYDGSFLVADAGSLKVRSGDPLAIMSDVNGKDLSFFMVIKINDNVITITPSRIEPAPERNYVAGAIVQNLANRWYCPVVKDIGIAAQIIRPDPVPFMARREENNINVIITVPINTHTIKFYDVYVRNERFSQLESHWMADAEDIDIYRDEITVNTFNGGENAGGGKIGNNNYFVTVITKDKSGRVNVNESTVQHVELI